MTSAIVDDQLNFTIEQGAERQLVFTLTDSSNNPINLTGLVVEFVAEAIDGTQTVKILNTDVSNPMGSVSIPTPTNGVATLTLLPVATAAIYAARGGYVFWALWVQPGSSGAYTVVAGQIVGIRAAQP